MRHAAAGVAVGVHEQLGVGVDRDEGLEVAVSLDQVHHVLHLDLRVSWGAVVGLGARVAAGPGAWREDGTFGDVLTNNTGNVANRRNILHTCGRFIRYTCTM